MQTRSHSTLLGKRAHHTDPSTSTTNDPPTPDPTPNPKRARTGLQGDWNKENIAPFTNPNEPLSPPITPTLTRTSSEYPTPSRTRISPRRHSSTSDIFTVSLSTPTTEVSHLSLSTPPLTPIQSSLQPIHARARAFLRATCNGSSTHIAGREMERQVIKNFLSRDDKDTTTLYISGSPGTGKTALVNSILCEFQSDVVSINCMALNSVDELWDRMAEELDGKQGRGKKVKGREAVLKALEELDRKYILVLDELDHIATSPATLTSIFSLTCFSSSLRMIGIANTHTLTSSRPAKGVKTLHFAPYTPTQLLDILHTRLQPLFESESAGDAKKFLPPPTLTLLTKKVAAQTGDVRSLFEVLRGAIDLASTSASGSKDSIQDTDQNPLHTPPPTVTPAHILSALKAHAPSSTPTRSSLGSSSSTPTSSAGAGGLGGNSETATKVRNLGLQAQLALLSILLASKRLEAGLSLSGSPSSTSPKPKSPIKRTSSASSSTLSNTSGTGIETTTLHTYYTTVLTRASNEVFTPVSRSEFADVVGMLEVVGLACLSSAMSASPVKGKKTFGRSASFGSGKVVSGGEVKIAEGVRVDEVLRGLGVGSEDQKDIRAEEICAIWEKEKARLGKDVRASEAKHRVKGGDVVFGDAMED